MNMFKKNKATTVAEYLSQVPDDRKEMIATLHELIIETVPSLKPNFIYNMPGYGKFKYTNRKKEEMEWPVIALANQKNYVSIYVCAVDDGEYIAEKHKQSLANKIGKGKLGKVSVGKSCIRFKKLEDINFEVLKKILKFAEKKPGLVKPEDHKKNKKTSS